MPPSLKKIVREQGRADHCLGSDASTDSYTIFSIESLSKLWCRIYSGTIDRLSYQESFLFYLEVTLACIILTTHCLMSMFDDKTTNQFDHQPDQIRYLPPPYRSSCSFCTGEYNKLFPAIIRGGVCKIIVDLLSGENRIPGAITFNHVLFESIIKYKGCNRLIFGVKSDKKPAPRIEVKKLSLILISAGILGHYGVIQTSDEEGVSLVVKINVTLPPSIHNKERDSTGLANFDDIYWRRIRARLPIIG